jgi:hypothetical protein
VRAVWSAIEMASYVDLFRRHENFNGTRGSGMMELMCAITSFSKRLKMTVNMPVSFKKRYIL